MSFSVALLFISGALNSGSPANLESIKHNIGLANSIISENRATMDDSQLRVAQSYVETLQSALVGDDAKQIELLDKLYELSSTEYEKEGVSTLWKLFHIDYAGFPLRIAVIARDAEGIDPAAKFALLERQEARSQDYRISNIILNLVRDQGSIESEIAKTEQYVAKRPDEMQFRVRLVELRLKYQLHLIVQAHKDRGLSTENPGDWDYDIIEHDQTCIALEEARVAVGRAPKSFQHSFFPIFRNALQDKLADCDQVSSFFEFGLERMKESPDIDEAAVTDTIDKIDAAMEKYCPEARLAQER